LIPGKREIFLFEKASSPYLLFMNEFAPAPVKRLVDEAEYSYLQQRLRMCGDIPPLIHTPSRYGA
jgi:hypothetical protein